jgi:hypothetical protein
MLIPGGNYHEHRSTASTRFTRCRSRPDTATTGTTSRTKPITRTRQSGALPLPAGYAPGQEPRLTTSAPSAEQPDLFAMQDRGPLIAAIRVVRELIHA